MKAANRLEVGVGYAIYQGLDGPGVLVDLV